MTKIMMTNFAETSSRGLSVMLITNLTSYYIFVTAGVLTVA